MNCKHCSQAIEPAPGRGRYQHVATKRWSCRSTKAHPEHLEAQA